MFPNKSNVSRYFLFLTIDLIHPWVKEILTADLEEAPLLSDHPSEDEAIEDEGESRIATVEVLAYVPCTSDALPKQKEVVSFKLKANLKKEKY